MRADLIALTPEAIAALANVGLVKRALRELEQGKGPTLLEEPDGTVVGTFEDGVSTRLAPGRLLRNTVCTCPSAGVCRHRVAVALAYRAFVGGGANVVDAAHAVPWSPGEIDDVAIERTISKRALEEARTLRRRGVIIEVVRPSTPGEPPTARLPSCTVRFLVPRDLAYARCDCAVSQGCAHVALAVWAFRRADVDDPARASLSLELRTAERRDEASDADALALALVLDLAQGGVVHAREALAQRFALAREALLEAGLMWTVTALDDLELALARYRARSARYRASDVLGLLAEIVARGRAARAENPALPSSSILGRGEAMETKLDHSRLVGLGCRFDADDRERWVEILLADPDTGTVLVMEKTWTFAAGELIPDAHELARRRFSGVSAAALARGQLVTRVARRRANRMLVLGGAREGASSVTPQTGDFTLLPTPLRVDRLADLENLMASRAPRLIRPRVRAESVHAVRIGAVEEVVFDAAEQTLIARVRDPEGAALLVRRAHRRVAPRALDELGRVLLGAYGKVSWIVGPVARTSVGLVLDPTLIVADRVVVPDVEDGLAADLPPGRAGRVTDAIGDRLETASRVLEEVIQLGVSGLTPAHEERLAAAARGLDALGMASLASRLEHARREIALARRQPSLVPRTHGAARAILDAAIRLELTREARSASAPIVR